MEKTIFWKSQCADSWDLDAGSVLTFGSKFVCGSRATKYTTHRKRWHLNSCNSFLWVGTTWYNLITAWHHSDTERTALECHLGPNLITLCHQLEQPSILCTVLCTLGPHGDNLVTFSGACFWPAGWICPFFLSPTLTHENSFGDYLPGPRISASTAFHSF